MHLPLGVGSSVNRCLMENGLKSKYLVQKKLLFQAHRGKLMPKDIIEVLDDLAIQAERENSHYYVWHVLKQAKGEILALRSELERYKEGVQRALEHLQLG